VRDNTEPQQLDAEVPTYRDVYSFPSLLAAFRKARRAKRGKGGEPEFYLDLEKNLLRLSQQLKLHLKHNATTLAPVREGTPWLGFRVFPGTVRLKHESKVRFYSKLSVSMNVAFESPWDEADEVARAASLCGHVAHANTRALRRAMMAGHLRKTDSSHM